MRLLGLTKRELSKARDELEEHAKKHRNWDVEMPKNCGMSMIKFLICGHF